MESQSTGKWADPIIPKTDWVCVAIGDHGRGAWAWCEMCEAREIRFWHRMRHASFSSDLVVGRICAGYLEGDLVAPVDRERLLQSRSRRRANWIDGRWRVSANGNTWRESDGCRIVILGPSSKSLWAYLVVVEEHHLIHEDGVPRLVPERKAFSEFVYKTRDEAKLAAFDLITHVIAKRPRGARVHPVERDFV